MRYIKLFEEFSVLEKDASAPLTLKIGIDDLIDGISAVIDTIPGVGNLISAGVDVAHALSYLVRFGLAKSEDEKFENATLCLITLGAATLPVAGNALPVAARKGIKEVMKQTPASIMRLGTKLGIQKNTAALLSKSTWKWKTSLLLSKLAGEKIQDFLKSISDAIRKVLIKVQNSQVKGFLGSMVAFIDEMKTMAGPARELATEIIV